MAKKMVYFFGSGKAEGQRDMKDLLGGKGANLAEMTNLGIPVPPGFTISTETCADYYSSGHKWPAGLAEQVEVSLEDDKISVAMQGCHLCWGNDLLRAKGLQGFCPFAPGINRAVSKSLKGGSRLEGVKKSAEVTGTCRIDFTRG